MVAEGDRGPPAGRRGAGPGPDQRLRIAVPFAPAGLERGPVAPRARLPGRGDRGTPGRLPRPATGDE